MEEWSSIREGWGRGGELELSAKESSRESDEIRICRKRIVLFGVEVAPKMLPKMHPKCPRHASRNAPRMVPKWLQIAVKTNENYNFVWNSKKLVWNFVRRSKKVRLEFRLEPPKFSFGISFRISLGYEQIFVWNFVGWPSTFRWVA